MANNLGRFILSSLLGGGSVHDYSHAAKTFRPQSFARAGKTKYLFHVVFNVNRTAGLQVPVRELSYLVKKVDLPKYSMDVRTLNQYNRKNLIQTKINYQPVNITFHDDNGNQIRELWRTYYNYHYADGRYQAGSYKYSDTYRSSRLQKSWGLDSGATEPFFSSIDIYSMHAGMSMQMSLINPIITAFNHDMHDYSEGTSLMEHTMTVQYTSVKYTNGYWSGVPGFADGQFYDTNPSDLAGDYAGVQVDPNTGSVFQPNESMYDAYEAQKNQAFVQATQNVTTDNTYKSTVSGMTSSQFDDIVLGQNQNDYLPYEFPTATTDPGAGNIESTNQGAVDVGQNIQAVSENSILSDDRQYIGIYEQGTWQRQLEEKGYDPRSIAGAENATNTALLNNNVINNADAARYAEEYITGTNSSLSTANQYLTDPPTDSIVDLQDSTVVSPVYDAQTWQQNLLAKGYKSSDITLVENNLLNVKLAPSIDKTQYAETYLARYK